MQTNFQNFPHFKTSIYKYSILSHYINGCDLHEIITKAYNAAYAIYIAAQYDNTTSCMSDLKPLLFTLTTID